MKSPILVSLGNEITACGVGTPDLDVVTAADSFEECDVIAVEAANIGL